jgi:AcrR family transcriptional regulator
MNIDTLLVAAVKENRVSEKRTAATGRVSHAAQKHRTRTALVTSCRTLIASGADISMPAVAQAAGVSEATAYRHFADLVSLVNEALRELWPSPSDALAPVSTSPDAVERIDFACEFLLRRVYSYQGSVRAVIGATITRPALAPARPGFRFGLIDLALDPVIDTPTKAAALRLAQLKEDLAAVVSAEALFSLTDLCGLDADRAIDSLRRTARTITEVAVSEIGGKARPR